MTMWLPPKKRVHLTPGKLACLRALMHGPLEGGFDRWWSAGGPRFNWHTVSWLAAVGYVTLNRALTRAEISAHGREYLSLLDGIDESMEA